MSRLSDLLSTHWFAFSLFAAGLLAAGTSLFKRQRHGAHSLGLLLLAAALGLFGVGDLVFSAIGAPGPDDVRADNGGLAFSVFWGLCLASAALAGLLLMFVVLLLSGKWWPPLAWAMAALLVIGIGGAFTPTASATLTDAYSSLRTLEPRQEWVAKGFSAIEYVLE